VSVTAAKGFVAAGIAAGIKASADKDLAVVATDDGRAVTAAAVFTSNLATAAPVQVSRAHLDKTAGRAAAVILNSGNANAATGERGVSDAERMCELTAAGLACETSEVLVCSTGLIGFTLPMDVIEPAVPTLVAARTPHGGTDAADAILTTDTHRKEVVVVESGFTVGGMAKGAAMLAPNMATMLAVLTTDAAVPGDALADALRAAVEDSFNRLSVDGCTSTNDTVIVLANGRAGDADPGAVRDALTRACDDLASQMAGDAEGASKVVRVEVVGARSDVEARLAARAVGESQLVKCSLYGEDPYWGRIVSELGAAGVGFDPGRVSVAYGDITVCFDGVAVPYDEQALRAHMGQRHIRIRADLGLGTGEGSVLTNDLTHAYIDENMRTS
jgi:glutamate N-acetyltransferase / amino-acid N-acetyltransferase